MNRLPEPQGIIIPHVIEQTPRGERGYDIYSRLLKERIVFIGTDIDGHVANLTVAQLLFLQGEDDTEPINLYINSPGGVVTSGLAIYDTMQYVRPEIHTWCVGHAMSVAAVLLAGGAAGHRAALPNAKVLIHQPWVTRMGGPASDIEIHAREILRTRDLINEILAHHTGQEKSKIERDTERDFFMTAEEAREYGIVDLVPTAAPLVGEQRRAA